MTEAGRKRPGLSRIAALLAVIADAALALSAPGSAAAQPWAPPQNIHLVVPFTAGGTADIIGRLLAQSLSDTLGQAVVVDNRAGGSNRIATEAIARSAPDGSVIGMISTAHATNAILVKDLPYDSIKSFEPLTLVGRSPIVLLVNANSPARSVQDLLQANNGDGMNYGSPGVGSAAHLAGELFKMKTGARFVHIAYRGGAPAMNDLLAGQVHMLFNAFASTLPLVESGKLRVLAIADTKRSPLIPDVPTMQELGLGDFAVYEWFGLVLPTGTPDNIRDRIHADTIKFMGSPLAKERLTDRGVDLVKQTPKEFQAFVEDQIAKDRAIIVSSGIQLK